VFIVLEYFQLTGVSGRVFPALYPLPNVTDYLMPPPFSPSQVTDYLDILSRIVVGSDTQPWYTQLLEPAFSSGKTLHLLQPRCMPFMFGTIPYNAGGVPLHIGKLKLPSLQC
jgi:hypothetical protein